MPFDADPDWPRPLQDALTEYRAAWRAKMDEVNACIAANAETEELVDKPEIVNGAVRVAGPFTMEGVIAREEGPDSPIGGAPEELEAFGGKDTGELAVAATPTARVTTTSCSQASASIQRRRKRSTSHRIRDCACTWH